GGEALVVELVRRIDERRRGARRVDLVPCVVALAPEGRPPGLVERRNGAVAPPEPGAKRRGGRVAIAGRDVAAVLIVDVPHRQRRMALIALGKAPDQRAGRLAVDGAAGTVLLAPAGPQHHALRGHRQALGMAGGEPG